MGKEHSGHFRGTSGDRGTGDIGGLFGGDGIANGFPLSLHEGQQGKHIPGHNNYIKGRSIFYGSMDDARALIRKFGGTGIRYPSSPHKATVDFGEVIGKYVGLRDGEGAPTTWGTIHYSKTGAHIVPSKPR